MLLEARDDTATRQGDGLTEYDGMVQPAAVGMEVERPTDETGGADRDAAGTTTASSTDTAATNAGVVRMEVSTDTTATGAGVDGAAVGASGGGTDTAAAPKKRYRKKKKETAGARHARRDAAKARKRRDG